MSPVDPGILALALGDLQEELVLWSAAAGEALHAAEDAQHRASEAVERMLHRANIVQDQAQRDQRISQDIRERCIALVHEFDGSVATAKATLQMAAQLHKLAQTTVRHWLAELSAAQAWLTRAEHRLELALKELAAAEAELRSAQWSLSSAESSLRA